MKKFLLFSLCLLFGFAINAQNCQKSKSSCTTSYDKSSCKKSTEAYQQSSYHHKKNAYADKKVPKWVIGSIGISLGQDQDRLSNLGSDYFLDMVKSDLNNDYSNLNFEKGDIHSMTCENPNVRLDLSLIPTFARNLELRLGINAISNRIDAISYDWSNQENWDDLRNSSNISFTSYSNEVAAEAAILKTLKVANFLKFSAGLGSNVGTSFNNRLHVYGSEPGVYTAESIDFRSEGDIRGNNWGNNNYYEGDIEMSNGLHHRAYAVGGVGLTFFKRLELGVEGRYGMGYRYNPGAAVQSTRLSSIFMTARWNLNTASKYQNKAKKSCGSYYKKESCTKAKKSCSKSKE